MPRRPTRYALALLGGLALLVLSACVPTATMGRSPTATGTRPPAPSATPSPTPVPDWRLFTDPKFGFQAEAPGMLWIDPNGQPQQQTATDSTTVLVYHATPDTAQSPMAQLFSGSGGLMIYASTAPARCDLRGTPEPVGQGIAGFRYDTFAPPPGGGATAFGGGVTFVSGGVYVNLFIGASGQTSPSAYWAAYGPTWRHILASFVAGPATAAHPCG